MHSQSNNRNSSHGGEQISRDSCHTVGIELMVTVRDRINISVTSSFVIKFEIESGTGGTKVAGCFFLDNDLDNFLDISLDNFVLVLLLRLDDSGLLP
jgi:hypothetical protein